MLECYSDHAGKIVGVPGSVEFITALHIHEGAVIFGPRRRLGHILEALRRPFFALACPTLRPFLVWLGREPERSIQTKMSLQVDHRVLNARMRCVSSR